VVKAPFFFFKTWRPWLVKILGIDTEATGLDAKADFITEIGAVVWCTEKKAPLWLWHENLRWDGLPKLSSEIVELTGITDEHLEEYGNPQVEGVFRKLRDIMDDVEACVAHNAPFDRGMLAAGFAKVNEVMPEKHWIDTAVDIPYPKKIKSRSLNHVCADHRLTPNEFPHRAIFDVMQMLKLLAEYDFSEVLERSRIPNVRVVALCRKPWEDPKPEGEKDTQLAKANGFYFDGALKSWYKNCKANEVEALSAALPFTVKVVNES
jgi:DNA polymerase-3 subunit epsilon